MNLDRAVTLAMRAFDRGAGWPWCAAPAVPILFFGDLHAYRASPLRVLTVGLNPSLYEFPADDPFQRFPLARDGLDRKPRRYLDAMCAYFRTDPYRGWFQRLRAGSQRPGSELLRGWADRRRSIPTSARPSRRTQPEFNSRSRI